MSRAEGWAWCRFHTLKAQHDMNFNNPVVQILVSPHCINIITTVNMTHKHSYGQLDVIKSVGLWTHTHKHTWKVANMCFIHFHTASSQVLMGWSCYTWTQRITCSCTFLLSFIQIKLNRVCVLDVYIWIDVALSVLMFIKWVYSCQSYY